MCNISPSDTFLRYLLLKEILKIAEPFLSAIGINGLNCSANKTFLLLSEKGINLNVI